MPIHDKSPRPQEFAAVDLGSNSFHMVIARVVDGAMQIIGRLKQRVHLADGLGPDNMLSEEAMTPRFKLSVAVCRTAARVFSCQRLYSWHPYTASGAERH
ncbi:exopolyphosphatase [Escherichia coli]|uniref:Exopolyphosphatase n=1 Tax=Escherichia coli TaxID=562 RepID=A0A376VEY8_ECOLX|nr:exopolyphosphatase [Escherichia coli]